MLSWKHLFSSLLKSWFPITMTSIFLFSLILRFWQISQFNTFVFDEVYYAKFGNNYLIGKQFFNSHPPVSQYFIAIGIWIGSYFPAAPDTVNNLTGSLRSTFSYRWLNAFTGSFIPLLVGAIAYQLTYRRRYTVIASLFAATDGLFLVESRYALSNIYIIFFGLLGQLFFLLAIRNQKFKNWQLIFSGIFFGASIAVKWNGLGFLLGVYLFLASSGIMYLFKKRRVQSSLFPYLLIKKKVLNNWINIEQFNLINLLFSLVIIPFLTYGLLWIPHLLMNPQYGFWKVHQEIFAFHQKIGNSPDVHPYCSPWYSWLFMWRPVAYFYETETIAQTKSKLIYDVHAMGNPVLWWLSTAAIFLLISKMIIGNNPKPLLDFSAWMPLYLLCNYTANLLPWLKVNRCLFLYHYMEAYIFSWLALAWIVDSCLQSRYSNYRRTGQIIILFVVAAFIFWLPIYLGLPLSPKEYQMRMLFPNWI